MPEDTPLVTVVISTRDRGADVRQTLRHLRLQDHPALELLVIDDGSRLPVGPAVREEWPGAVVVRNECSAGQSRRRSEGFALARGEYILQLDDDSYPVQPSAVRQAVSLMSAQQEIGGLSLRIFNGDELAGSLPPSAPGYVSSFVGCGVLFRAAAIREVGGYRSFFGNEWEEEEASLRLLKAGWAIYFLPEVLIHHRVSPHNRRTARTWMRGFRNKLWALVMHYPLQRLVLEGLWTLGIAGWDAIRLLRPHYLVCGLAQFVAGLPRALRLRNPMSRQVLALYDALRFLGPLSEEDYRTPPRVGLAELWRWYRAAWRARARQRSVWDRRPGDIGSSATVAFAHEYSGIAGRGGESQGAAGDRPPDQRG